MMKSIFVFVSGLAFLAMVWIIFASSPFEKQASAQPTFNSSIFGSNVTKLEQNNVTNGTNAFNYFLNASGLNVILSPDKYPNTIEYTCNKDPQKGKTECRSTKGDVKDGVKLALDFSSGKTPCGDTLSCNKDDCHCDIK